MTGLLHAVGDAVVRWAVPAVGGLFLTFVTVKHRAIMDWRRQRDARSKSLDQMLTTWPTFLHQVSAANEGASRTTAEFAALHDRFNSLDKDVGDLLAMNYGQFELSPVASFVCDNDGRNMLANSAYGRLLHTGRDDLMGFGYRRFIPSDELDAYLPKFSAAARDHREFESDLRMHCADGAELRVRVRMVPHPRQKGPATHWIGTIALIEGHC